jgi:hypothetical protein
VVNERINTDFCLPGLLSGYLPLLSLSPVPTVDLYSFLSMHSQFAWSADVVACNTGSDCGVADCQLKFPPLLLILCLKTSLWIYSTTNRPQFLKTSYTSFLNNMTDCWNISAGCQSLVISLCASWLVFYHCQTFTQEPHFRITKLFR